MKRFSLTDKAKAKANAQWEMFCLIQNIEKLGIMMKVKKMTEWLG